MTEKPPISGRPTLTIDEALEKLNWKVADLFYMAEIGELTIYAIADGWKVGRIVEIDNSMELDQSQGVTWRDLNGNLQVMPSDVASSDLIFWGNYIQFGCKGQLRVFYDSDLKDQQPITARTFEKYRISPENATIEIDFNKLHKLTDKVHERYIYPKPNVLIQDLLLNGKLVVLRVDIERLLSGESADTKNTIDNKPLATRERNTFLHIIRALGKMAELPVEPYAAADLILAELSDEHGNSPISRSTIANKISQSRTIL